MKSQLYILFVAIIVIASVTGIKYGFQAKLTPKALDLFRDLGIRELEKEVGKLTIPDISGEKDHVHYSVSGIHVTSFNIPGATIATKENVGITVSTQGVSLSIHGDWRYYIKHVLSDHGSFDATINNVAISLTVRIGVDSAGHPTVQSSGSDCYFHVSGIDVTIHGKASVIYNLFKSVIESELKKTLNKEVCDIVIKEVNTDLKRQLSTLKLDVPITDSAELDYSLVASPVFNSSISTFHKGEVYQTGHHREAPIPVPDIPSDPDESRMIFMWLTDYVPNTAGYVLHKTGFLQYNVTQDQVPAGSPFNLNTSSFSSLFGIPQVAKLYPNMLMQLNLNTTAPPKITMTPGSIRGLLVGDIAAYAVYPNKTLAYMFTLNSTLTLSVTVGFSGTNLTWNSTKISTDVTLLQTNIGTFSLGSLKAGLGLATNLYVIPTLNRYGKQGVPLPSLDGYIFSKPTISLEQGCIKIGTDLKYAPQQKPRKDIHRMKID